MSVHRMSDNTRSHRRPLPPYRRRTSARRYVEITPHGYT